MPPVAVEIQPRPADLATSPNQPEVTFDPEAFAPEFIPDLDALAESAKCSCSASDDNPY